MPDVSEQTYRYFEQESTDLLQVMNDELQTLRQNFSLQKVHTLMRAAHTLKGASASVGLETVQKTTHSLEDIFRVLCHKDTVVTEEIEQLVFQGFQCLQLLMSAQLAGSQIDEDDFLDRMASVVSQLQQVLGDRFDQAGHLPTSSDLGFDMTQSIFQMGVTQRIEALSEALENPSPEELRILLKSQSEVFVGLAESLGLPGFEEIARMTGFAIAQYPELILQIAPVALADFKAARQAVLDGDRTQGGYPSISLQQFCGRAYKQTESSRQHQSFVDDVEQSEPQREHSQQQEGWLKRGWKRLTHPIGTPASRPQPPAALAQIDVEEHSATPQRRKIQISENLESADSPSKPTAPELEELTPIDLGELNLQPSEPPRFEQLSIEPSPLSQSSPPQSIADDTEQASGATIRISVDHLTQLSQSVGELLTEQNRQTLYNEELNALVRKLLARISKQQQQLSGQQSEYLIRQQFSASSGALSSGATASPAANRPDKTRSHKIRSQQTQFDATQFDATQFDAIELTQYSDIQLLLQSCVEETIQQSESAEAIDLYVKRSGQALEKQKRLLTQTRETLLAARMVALDTILTQFPPMIDRLVEQHKKPVSLDMEGGDILIDKSIVDKLYEPLLHLIRNAFDHGIESPDKRLDHGKSLAGNITVKGAQRGRHLILSVEDDGQGIDLETVRQKAIAQQLITPAAAAELTPEQTTDLLFEPGFSTVVTPDELSGRGIGLDVVKAQVRSLQGWITVSHEPGVKTCFTMQIPASLTIAKLLLCQTQGRVYALIADAVEHILIPTAKQMRTWKGGKMLTWQASDKEHLVPVNALNEVLHYASPMSDYRRDQRSSFGGASPSAAALSGTRNGGTRNGTKEPPSQPVILLRHQHSLVGLEVEQLLGEQELVISPLGNTIAPPAYLYGSSILPDGQLTLVLDGAMLANIIVQQRKDHLEAGSAIATAKSTAPPKDKPVFIKKLILTIDDSITVRNTLSEALQKHNYRVIQAHDGAEALELLKRYPEVQAILCDIEMPGMNGFDFLRARQQDPELAAIPTLMLTSRAGDKHRLLTEELGATGYITKPYLTPKLLAAVAAAIESQAVESQTIEKQTVESPAGVSYE
ncbi:MAG: response regulator [Cyanobacteria bacterium J06581_3]